MIKSLNWLVVVVMTSFIVLLPPANINAQNKYITHTIHLKSGEIIAPANASHWLDSMNKVPSQRDLMEVLIHFNTMPDALTRAELEQSGITLLDYIPDNTFIATISFPFKTTNIESNSIYGFTPMKPDWKADKSIWKQISNTKGNIEILVSFYKNISVNAAREFINANGGKIHACPMEKYGSYKVIIPAAKVRSLASWYGVKSLSPVSDMVPFDLQSRPAVRGNVAVTPPQYGGFGLLGDSVTVGVGDNSSGIYHADLKDRVINFAPGPISHHGEHVNGIVGSSTIVDPLAASMAPHVTLLDYFFDLMLPDTKTMYQDYRMNVTNNSYGVILGDCNYSGTYDAYAQLIDTLAIENPYVLHVFASGNDGGMNCAPYPQGFATVAGGYQPAKNNMVVGSYTDYLIQAGDESRGPTKDGRLKPDIIATGLGAYSTINVDGYEWAAGTSMASPQAVGGLAILTQRFKQLNGGAIPNADLLKAFALNGALDLGNPGPDYSYGFGGMDVCRSLLMIDSGNYFRSAVAKGDSQVFTLNIPPNTAQLKAMICWIDPPANPLASKELINDLDLRVFDNGGNKHLPLVLDPTPANVNNLAIEKEDHLNNVEQVTINNPAPGNYSINIKGYNIATTGTQPYALVYDIIPKGVLLTYPLGGEQVSNIDSIRIFWDGVTDSNSFTVQYTTDSGATWSTISNNVPPDVKHCDFMPTGINSGRCMVKISRNGTSETATSGCFAINTQPVITLDSSQCPGYVSIHWSPVTNASAYLMLAKKGFYMQVVDSITDTAYTFRNMSLTEKSYVAVMPVINGIHGYRSVAAITIANSGNCSNPISKGDLMIEKILSPVNGRMFSLSQLSNNETLKVRIRNLYNINCNQFSLSYKINSSGWNTSILTAPLPADTVTDISIPGLDLSATGNYTISVTIHNNQDIDPNPLNDSLIIVVKNIVNDTINLSNAFTDSFETMPIFSTSNDSVGISPNGHWDYQNGNDSGRIRSFVSNEITFSGQRAISLDENQCVANGSYNKYIGTFNLKNYDTASAEIRVDFDYLLHGTPKTTDGNIVQARSIDTSSWAPLYNYDLTAYPGFVRQVRSLSLTDALRSIKRNFTTSTQISFGQNDTSLIAATNYGNGMTIDNFRLYTVANDAQMMSIVNPLPTNCGLSATTPLIVKVHNGVNKTLYNVTLQYQLDNGVINSGLLDSLKAKDTIDFTFSQLLNIAAAQSHTINVWLSESGDTYKQNDSIVGYKFRNSAIVTTYPYLENFESGDGGYFSDGFKNSWQYGTPASPKINKAASGTKAWKTNLTGNYNTLEKSYLYSPCFDISSLNNPMLSVSIALDIENCGNTLCDQAYMEYSFDGVSWSKLGNFGQGTNWYDSTFNIWNTENYTRWHVASIPLPKPPVGETFHFRIAMASDPGTDFEGIAIDDIHIFDRKFPIVSSDKFIETTESLSGNNWTDITNNSEILLSVQPNGQNLGNSDVALYHHDTLFNPNESQYTFPRSYRVLAGNTTSNNTGIRLYLTETDLLTVLNDTSCSSCTKPVDAYSLGITGYNNSNDVIWVNGSLLDDTSGSLSFYPYNTVKWVPNDNGYYAEINGLPYSEYWFNDGGPTKNFSAVNEYLDFTAYKNRQNIFLNWYSLIDTSVYHYSVQKSTDGINFSGIIDTVAAHIAPAGIYTVIDNSGFGVNTTLYYRLRWTMVGRNTSYYSPIRKVSINDTILNIISFDAKQVNHSDVQLNWISEIDQSVSYYLLERNINGAGYTTLTKPISKMNIGQQYSFIDQPYSTLSIPDKSQIQYRLTANLTDSSKLILPIRTISWSKNNYLVNIYPIPTYTGTINLEYNADINTKTIINIYDITGRMVTEFQLSNSQWNNQVSFSILNLSKGMYFAKILIGTEIYVVKLINE